MWNKKNGTRQSRGYGAEYARLRECAMQRDKHLCQPCMKAGRIEPATECDHILPKHKGGDNSLSNLQAICSACHKEKTRVEAATKQGRRPKRQVGQDGWPVG